MTEAEKPADHVEPTPATPAEEAPQAATPDAAESASAIPPIEIGSAVEPAPIEQAAPKPPSSGLFWGTGRRKRAIARVRVMPGEGKIMINNREVDKYFHEPQEQNAVRAPLLATQTEKLLDVHVSVAGGGHAGQAGAIRLGIARAILKADTRYEPPLREKGYLTRDARVVERKKPGQAKARKRFQFSKR